MPFGLTTELETPLFRMFSSDKYCVLLMCRVSWGYDDSGNKVGDIAINGALLINTTSATFRGFNLVELNVSSCLSTKILHYDTCVNASDSENMAAYINGLPLNTVLIEVTSDEAKQYLTQNAESALLAIGVNVTGLQCPSWRRSVTQRRVYHRWLHLVVTT